jgi:hypothetical protein
MKPKKDTPTLNQVLGVVYILTIASIILACIALHFSITNNSNGLTPAEKKLLDNITNTVQITDAGCLVARCFTDAFVPNSVKPSVLTGVFEESEGNLSCATVTTEILTILDESGAPAVLLDQFALSVGTTAKLSSTQLGFADTLFISSAGIASSQTIQMAGDVEITETLVVGSFTTAERNALVPAEGTIVYDSGIEALAVFQNSAWFLLSNASGVLEITGSANIVVSGTSQNPILDLSTTAVVAGVYTFPTVEFDAFGRAIAASSNSVVESVTGTAGQIDATTGSNPVLSIDATLLASIQFWQNLEPTGSPAQNQFLQYRAPRLSWETVGTAAFPNCRNVYVDISGNDSTGDGSSLFPFLTVYHAIQVALAGNVSIANPVGIVVSAGLYIEPNPIIITKSGLNIVGCSQLSTWLRPSDPTQTFFQMAGGQITFQDCRLEALTSTSTASCFSFTSTFTLTLQNCLVRFFQTGLQIAGSGNTTSLALVNACNFVQNNSSITASGVTLLVNDSQFTGNLLSVASSSYNAIHVANSNTVLFVGAGCYFIRNGVSVFCELAAQAYLSSLNFSANITGIHLETQAAVNAIACNFVRMESTHFGIFGTGAGSVIKINACNINGLSASNARAGTGIVITDQCTMSAQACFVSNCALGVQTGTDADTASTLVAISNSEFQSNTVAVRLRGTSSFTGTLLNIDQTSGLVFDSTQNVELVYSSPGSSGLSVGTLTNTVPINVIGVGSKLVNSPALIYYPDVYAHEELAFTNPDPAASSSLGVISQSEAHLDVLTTDITGHTGIHMYTDLSGFDGSQVRGWHVYKNNTGQLSFEYNNNISGQPTVSGHVVMRLDSVNNSVFFNDSVLSWTGGANLYESAPGVLATDSQLIVGGLNTNTVVTTNGSKRLVSSSVTATELGYLSGVTSAVQTQINSKVNRSGDTMTGALGSSFAGSASAPSFAVNGSGMFASATNHLSFATANVNRLDIDASGQITVSNFGVDGVVKSTSGLLSSALVQNADITNSTIATAKLAAKGSASAPSTIVVRDASSNFATNMITLLGTTTNATDAATKAYVDTQVTAGLSVKLPVVVVSIADIDLSTGTLLTIDGVTLIAGDRVLLVGQTSPVQNGCWLAATGAWTTRGSDFDTGSTAGTAYFLVTSGTVYTGSSWVCNTPTAIVGTNALGFAEFSLPQSASGNNLGDGTGKVYVTSVGSVLQFNSLKEGAFVTLTTDTDNIVIAVNADTANTASTVVARDGSGGFSAGTIVASLTGHASEDLKLSTGGTLGGNLTIPAGSDIAPSLVVGLAGVGLSEAAGALQLSAGASLALSISSSGVVTIPNLSTDGVVKVASNVLSSAKILNSDITVGTIQNTSLSTISSANTAGNIVVRDGSGGFAAGIIVASLTGNVTGTVTGHSSLDVRLAGDTMTGELQVPVGTFGTPSLQVGDAKTGLSNLSGALQLSTNSAVGLSINSSGTVFIPGLSTGVAHVGALGIVSSSLIVTTDITDNTVTNAKLTGNPVSTKTPSTIVLRDSQSAFAAGIVTVDALATTATNILIGNGASTLQVGNVIIGLNATRTANAATGNCIVIGTAATCSLDDNIVIGHSASSTGNLLSIVIGNGASGGTGFFEQIAIGNGALAGGNSAISIGTTATTGTHTAICIGYHSTMTGAGVLVGIDCTSSGKSNIFGDNNTSSAAGADIFGSSQTNSTANSLLFSGYVNIRAGTGSCDLGTTSVKFQNLFLSGAISCPTLDFAGAVSIGVSSATSVGIGKVGVTTTVNGPLTVTGATTLSALSSTGVVHNSSAGLLSTSLIVDADVSASAGIVDTKLATISTALKVSNSATTATSANTASAIVARDASGNFTAGVVTAGSLVSTSLDFAGAVSVGTSSATSVTIGKSGVTTTVNGPLAMGTQNITGTGKVSANQFFPAAAYYYQGYSVFAGSTAFTAATTRLTTLSNFTQSSANAFSSSGQVITYNGAETVQFNITYTISSTQQASAYSLLYSISLNGSLTLGNFRTLQTSTATADLTTSPATVSQLITLSTGNTIELNGQCTATLTILHPVVHCTITQ